MKPPRIIGTAKRPTPDAVGAISTHTRGTRANSRAYRVVEEVISPFTAPWEGIFIKFQMVYVEVPPPHRGCQPRFMGPAIVLETRDKVLTLKYLNGDVEKVNIARVRPVHKLREEMADLQLPIPERILCCETPAGNLEDADDVDPHDEKSVKFWASEEMPGTLQLSEEDQERLVESQAAASEAAASQTASMPRKKIQISFPCVEGGTPPDGASKIFSRPQRNSQTPGWMSDYVTSIARS